MGYQPESALLTGSGRGRVRMHRLAPDRALAGHVSCYWTMTWDGRGEVGLRLIPDGCVDVTFDLSGAQPPSVTGVQVEPTVHQLRGARSLLAVRFQPGAAFAFLGAPVNELDGEWSPLDALLGPLARELGERVAEARSLQERVQVLDAALLSRLAGRAVDPQVGSAVGALLSSGGALGVAELARRTGLCARQLGRRFDQWVGLGPKRLARIARVQRVLAAGAQGDAWAAIACDHGYFDQAHMIGDVARATGLTPARYLKLKSDSSNTPAAR